MKTCAYFSIFYTIICNMEESEALITIKQSLEHNFSSDNYCLVIIIIKITTKTERTKNEMNARDRDIGIEMERKNKIKSNILYIVIVARFFIT